MALMEPQSPESIGAIPEVRVDGCDTVPQLFIHRVREHPDKVALREMDFGIWNEYRWRDWEEQARFLGLGLKALGLQRGDVCSVAAEIRLEWMVADLGVLCVGGIVNGVYPTDAAAQVEYLINDSGTRFYFAEDEEQLDKVLEVRKSTPTLSKIIIFDMKGLRALNDPQCISLQQLQELGRKYESEHPDAWQREIMAVRAEDVAILTYTSGTTGKPKGAIISHRNILFQADAIQHALGITDQDEQLGFLPLAHVAGRMFYTFCGIRAGSTVNMVESLETTFENQQQVAPTLHFAVPRVWEKQYSLVTIQLKEGTALGRTAYAVAIKFGRKAAAYRQRGERLPPWLWLPWWLSDWLVLRNIRRLLGIDRARCLATGAAPIAPELIEWFWALGRPMYEVYGQTECSGLATSNMPGATRIGSVGRAIKGVELSLSAEGEVLIRGPGVIRGYWNLPEKSASTLRDGWLHTGDVGRIDEDGFVYILDRLGDLIITAGGKNITPSEIENQLKFSPFVSDAVVIGDKRPYLTCLVMIDHENVTRFAQEKDVPFTNYASLCHAQEVQDLIWDEIEKVNGRFARVETIRKFRLIDQLLDPEDEELTPTMKLKRKVVNRKYIDLIEAMYQG